MTPILTREKEAEQSFQKQVNRKHPEIRFTDPLLYYCQSCTVQHVENENSDGSGSGLCAGQRLRGNQKPS
jgi:hypothetical protein